MPRLVDINIRDHVRYTGDGLPGEPVNAPLPIGDPSSGVYHPTKKDIRDAIGDVEGDRIRAEAASAAAVAAQIDVQGATMFAADRAALLANTATSIPAGTIFATRTGDAYRVVSSGGHAVTAGGVRLEVLPTRGAYNVRAFGAKGDGVADDSAAFQAAVDAVGDGTLVVPPGDYRLRDVVAKRGTLLDCRAGSGEATVNASGTAATAVRMTYNGAGGVGSRIITFKAAGSAQWIKGGGIIGRPHLSGNHLCEILIDAQSAHGCRFDVEMSRATFAGLHLNGRNGVLSQFNKIDAKYVWGSQAASEGSRGIVLHGDSPNAGEWVGCTQNHVVVNGLVRNGDMVSMVGHCDNNKLDIHASTSGGGTGNSLAMYPGNAGKIAHVNKILYVCNDVYMGPGAYGNVFDFDTSEGARFWGGGAGLAIHQAQVDYISGKVYESPKAPLMSEVFVPASAMRATGAATQIMVAGTPVITLPESAEGGAAFTVHDPIWGAGQVSSIRWIARSSVTGDAFFWGYLTISAVGQGLTVDDEFSQAVTMPVDSLMAQAAHQIIRPIPAAGIVTCHLTRRPSASQDTSTAAVDLVGAIIRLDFNGPASLDAANPPHQSQL